MSTMSYATSLPDPATRPDFYEGVPAKRAIAWVIDVIVTVIISAPVLFFVIVPGLLFWPLLSLIAPILWVAGFFYRWATIAAGSATVGMRMMAIELRERDGGRLSGSTAFWHTAGYSLSLAMVPAQAVSALMMLMTPRGQGLSDAVLGTAMINRPL